jgi:hypothetical protein
MEEVNEMQEHPFPKVPPVPGRSGELLRQRPARLAAAVVVALAVGLIAWLLIGGGGKSASSRMVLRNRCWRTSGVR